MTILFVLAAILMLGIMVTVHEFGHFFAARITGIPVRAFGIGFGPKLFAWKSKKHETEFVLRLIPAGGYCAFYGEDEVDGKSLNDPRALNHHAVWKRLLTILLGPVMNFVLAFVVAVSVFMAIGESVGIEYGRVHIDSVAENSPAQAAGIQPGDKIVAIDGEDMTGLDEDNQYKALAVIGAYQEGDAPLNVLLDRGGEMVSVQLVPQMDAVENRMMIGVTVMIEAQNLTEPVGFGRAARLGADYCVTAGTAILNALKDLVTTGEGIEDTGGPVRIIQTITETTREYGFLAYLELLIMISVNLGLVNLLPIPGLDGSRAVFLIIEGICRKPVPQKVESYIHLAGYLFLLGVFVIFTYRDILHLFQ